MTLRNQRHDLARLNALMCRAEACDHEVQAIALDDRILPSDRTDALVKARARANEAWRKYNAASVAYARTYPPVAMRPLAWLRSLFARRVKA
jgi:hypothetical protein